jgi:hypothetical protein
VSTDSANATLRLRAAHWGAVGQLPSYPTSQIAWSSSRAKEKVTDKTNTEDCDAKVSVSGTISRSHRRFRVSMEADMKVYNSALVCVLRVLGLTITASAPIGFLTPVAAFAQSAAPSPQRAQASGGQPTEAEREIWRRQILRTPRPGSGCYTAAYPETAWREEACKTPPHKLYPPKARRRLPEIVGGGLTDYSATVTGNIAEVEGSFDPGTTVTGECAAQCSVQNGQLVCPTNPSCTSATENVYSLQLNALFSTGMCGDSPFCRGLQQFVYESAGVGFIQYWLDGYGSSGTSCPRPISANCEHGAQSDGWCPIPINGLSCVINSKSGAPAPSTPAASLSQLKVIGAIAGTAGATNDAVTVVVGDVAYTAPGDNYLDLGSQNSPWQAAEFNVFGDGGSDQAYFAGPATIHVRTAIANGTTSAPSPDTETMTGESNSLNLIGRPCPVGPIGGSAPAIIFTESNVSGATSPCACPSGQVWLPNSASCGPLPATCTTTGVCESSWAWSFSIACTGMDVGIVYDPGGCAGPGAEPGNCYAGFDGSSTATASWNGAAGPPNWETPGQQSSPTVCTTGLGQQNCNTFAISSLPACASPPSSPPPVCPGDERYCARFSPPECVPPNLCLIEPIHPPAP